MREDLHTINHTPDLRHGARGRDIEDYDGDDRGRAAVSNHLRLLGYLDLFLSQLLLLLRQLQIDQDKIIIPAWLKVAKLRLNLHVLRITPVRGYRKRELEFDLNVQIR